MKVDRRALLGAALAVTAAQAQTRAQPAPEVIGLWPVHPPGGGGPEAPEQTNSKGAVSNVLRPRLVAYRPARPNGAAIIVIAGGGYEHVEAGNESTPVCRWLQANGTTAFELIYRLPGEGWDRSAPFQDGQRAVRIVRAHADSGGIDPERIGVIGFSAGAHLAGMTAVAPQERIYEPVDAADTGSARPDFCGLIYPVLTMMPPYDHTHTRREIVGTHPGSGESEAYSVERRVDGRAPPTFLAHAADDPIAAVENSLMMFAALRAAMVAVEMHIFQSGGHAWGLGRPMSQVHAWPALFLEWGAQNAFLPAVAGNDRGGTTSP